MTELPKTLECFSTTPFPTNSDALVGSAWVAECETRKETGEQMPGARGLPRSKSAWRSEGIGPTLRFLNSPLRSGESPRMFGARKESSFLQRAPRPRPPLPRPQDPSWPGSCCQERHRSETVITGRDGNLVRLGIFPRGLHLRRK